MAEPLRTEVHVNRTGALRVVERLGRPLAICCGLPQIEL
jgi:hypothetical protein